MFEQSVIQQEHARPWAFGLSMTLQSAMIGSAMLLSVLHIQTMDIAALKNPLMAPPTPRVQEAVRIVGVVREGGIGIPRASVRPFVAPRTIPHGIPTIVDDTAGAPDLTPRVAGSVDGVDYGPLLNRSITTQQMTIPKLPPEARTAAPPRTEAPVRVSTGVMEAKIIRRVLPVYPPLARAARIQGKVHLMGIIGKDGTVQNVRAVDGHPLLIPAAIDAVRQWVYRPTLLSGEPVDVITPIEVNFILAQ
jgi:protein TonB